MKPVRNHSRLALAVLLALAAAFPSGAAAGAIEVGQMSPSNPSPFCKSKAPVEILAPDTGGVRPYQMPTDGVMVSWRTNAAPGAGQQMTMKVFRRVPDTADVFKVIAHDGPRVLKASSFNSFPTYIPVQAGDYVGLAIGPDSETVPNACYYVSGPLTDFLALAEAKTPDGGTVQLPTLASGGRPNIAAMLVPRPSISSVAPGAGSLGGGTSVAIRGSGFEGATGVSFGAAAAARFMVLSDTEIIAVTPPATAVSTVPVAVTVAGLVSTAAPTARFTYQGAAAWTGGQPEPSQGRAEKVCVVPRLGGKKLRAARRALKRARCGIGLIKGPRRHRAKAKVRRQQPRPGRVLAAGSTVDLVLRKPRRRR